MGRYVVLSSGYMLKYFPVSKGCYEGLFFSSFLIAVLLIFYYSLIFIISKCINKWIKVLKEDSGTKQRKKKQPLFMFAKPNEKFLFEQSKN